MEPYEITGPERSLQPESAAFTRQEQDPVQPFMQTEPQPPKPKLYDTEEAARITKILCEGFDPEYILLFGSLCGGTPHSDAAAYDLLIVTQENPRFGWVSVKRYLKCKMPPKHRTVAYINAYLYTAGFLRTHTLPFLRLAHAEGELLYCSDRHKFRRPKTPVDFGQAYCDAKSRYTTLFGLGKYFMDQAAAMPVYSPRTAAFGTAQAAVLFYHALFYVFHGYEPETIDIVLMHERLRTLSGELMLLFDSDSISRNDTLPCLKSFLTEARYAPEFSIWPQELQEHIGRVEKMEKIVEKTCARRLALYKERSRS